MQSICTKLHAWKLKMRDRFFNASDLIPPNALL